MPLGSLLIWLGAQGAFLPQKAPSRYVKRSAAMLILRPESLLANWTDVGGLDPFLREQVSRSCGFKLANDGVDTRTIQAYLGHKSIQHTVRYTELAPTRFKSLFRD